MEIASPIEVELKLALATEYLTILLSHPILAAAPHLEQHLSNTYFDTPTDDLANARVAVRLRQAGDVIVQTVKTAGQGGGGMSSRQEWEWQVPSLHIDQQALSELPPFQGRLGAAITHLTPTLNTDFTRRGWKIEWQESLIEMVLDEGEIVTGGAQVPICELELELKMGQPEALWSLALHLAEQVPLRPSDTSKAARGNSLAAKRWPLPTATTAMEWLHRATVALDAYHDSGQHEHLRVAQQALSQLAIHPQLDDDLRPVAQQLPKELSAHGLPSAAYGHAALMLAHRLASQTALR
ncbi:CYTH domain-containing protein [Vreelandella olivaria]|uniref:CYTH domain-containing protein n=1 Tax=Vreelandella olivaria TaxID=390919 RepID=UPI00201EA573|nr:CYTH domain-containing protein [Halomonas olivaria]